MNNNITDKRTKGVWETKDIFQSSTSEIIANNKRIALILKYDNNGNKLTDYEERKANAVFIVKACNEYEGLIEALKEAKDVIGLCSLIDKSNTCDKMFEKLKSLLTKAED